MVASQRSGGPRGPRHRGLSCMSLDSRRGRGSQTASAVPRRERERFDQESRTQDASDSPSIRLRRSRRVSEVREGTHVRNPADRRSFEFGERGSEKLSAPATGNSQPGHSRRNPDSERQSGFQRRGDERPRGESREVGNPRRNRTSTYPPAAAGDSTVVSGNSGSALRPCSRFRRNPPARGRPAATPFRRSPRR